MKFLVVNDPHGSDKPPIGRTDEYGDDILNKLTDCWGIADRTECDFVVFTGDIFHRYRGPAVAYRYSTRLLEVFYQAPCPVYAVAGNHDMSSKGVRSLIDRPFGFLAKARAFTWLHEARVVKVKGTDDDVLLIPRNWEPYIDTTPTVFKLRPEEAALMQPSRYAIMVAHAYILPPGETRPYPHHMAEDLPTNLLDVLVCGHTHEDLGVVKLASGCWFCNIGSVSRDTRTKHNQARTPEVLTVQMDRGEISFERHPLPSARPAEDVFFEQERAVERGMGEFAEAISAGLDLEETPLDELVAEHTKGQPAEVVARLKHYLSEGEEDG